MKTNQQQRGFSLVELVVVCVVVVAVCAVAWPGARLARSQAGLAGSLANLKKIGETASNYAADYDDQSWSFTWSPGNCPSDYPDLQYAGNAGEAVMFQAVDIVRRLSGRDDLPRVTNRYRPIFISTLVLADYLQESLPAEWMVSPGDKIRIEWQKNPDDPPDFGDQGGQEWERLFGPFGSSYGLMPAFWAPDEKVGSQQTIYQYKLNHALIFWPRDVDIGKRRMSEVLFPSHKVRVAERESYFFGVRPSYYLHPESRVPLLMADGSAAPRTTSDANASFSPIRPDDTDRVSLLDYVPHPVFEAPTFSGNRRDEDIDSKYKWTRRGLRGIDFNGQRAE